MSSPGLQAYRASHQYTPPSYSRSGDNSHGTPLDATSPQALRRASHRLSIDSFASPHTGHSPDLRHDNTIPLGFESIWPHMDKLSDLPIQRHQLMDEAKFETIRHQFVALCVHPSPLIFKAFNSACFPPLDVFNYLIMLYFRNINRVITVFHFPTLALNSSHWILPLSIAAEGCQYLKGRQAASYTLAMREFLRRALLLLRESDPEGVSSIELGQASVLHLISMSYSGDEELIAKARDLHCQLVDFCLREWKSSVIEVKVSNETDFSVVSSAWQRWIDIETTRRVGYLIWMLDCMLASQFDQRPLLSLEDAIVPLPYPEVLWETSSALRWHELMIYSEPSPSLVVAVQTLYVEKSLKKTLAEFSHIIIVYGLYHRMWDVDAWLKQPLALWDPPSNTPDTHDALSAHDWHPATLDRDQWREATYQSLEFLHLAAMRVIGAASGREHPTVCHLHLAAVVLFAPIMEIQEYARALVFGNTTEDRLVALRYVIHRWVSEDQRRARIAVVYAGVQFWHIRKFSASAFYEPHAVLISTLVLWAYGTFNMTDALHSTISEPVFSDDGTPMPIAMNVDRPGDSELVPLFINNGGRMLALMSGVGDVCGVQGPKRILTEGSKLLNTLDKWGCGRKETRLLEMLLQV